MSVVKDWPPSKATWTRTLSSAASLTNSARTPWAESGWTNATWRPKRPARGFWSISSAPGPLELGESTREGRPPRRRRGASLAHASPGTSRPVSRRRATRAARRGSRPRGGTPPRRPDRDGVAMLDAGAEEPLVRRDGLVEVLDGHAEMMDPPRLHGADAYPQATRGARGRAACRRSRTRCDSASTSPSIATISSRMKRLLLEQRDRDAVERSAVLLDQADGLGVRVVGEARLLVVAQALRLLRERVVVRAQRARRDRRRTCPTRRPSSARSPSPSRGRSRRRS